MCISDGRVVQFPRMLREGWGQEGVGDGVDRLGVCNIVSSLLYHC